MVNIKDEDVSENKMSKSGNGAAISDDGIQVASTLIDLIGRATYIDPLHLWDNDSTELASFSTSFTFVINSYHTNIYADGLTFFLAQINADFYYGGSIGLPLDFRTNTSKYQFMAVEFDTYRNAWDPIDLDANTFVGDHVGIDINSITSVAYRKWFSNITYGKEYKALINYYADSKNLSVSFTNYKNNLLVWETGLNCTVDLRKELPEWVTFGFSASTGTYFEKVIVRSWTFNSTKIKVSPKTIGNLPLIVKGKDNAMLKVVLIAETLVLDIVLAILAYFLWWRKKYDGDKEEEVGLASEMNSELEMRVTMP
ncbi:putative legume lectin, alpha chain, concanavalin A-like lectin/glucanase domain superfamily [Helianthus anomalus]